MDGIDRASKVASIAGEVAKIAAIVVGGVWILTNFIWVDGPVRAAALSTSTTLGINRWADGVCAIDVDVGVKNGSRQTVTVSATSLRLWAHTPSVDGTKVSMLDWDAVHALPPIWELPKDQSRLNMTYEPGQAVGYSYKVFVPEGLGQLIHSRLSISSPDQGVETEVFAERTTSLSC